MIAVLDAKQGRAGDLRRRPVTALTEPVQREPGCLSFIAYEPRYRRTTALVQLDEIPPQQR